MARIIGWLEKFLQLLKGIAQYDGQTKAYLTQWDTLNANEQGLLCCEWYPQGKGMSELLGIFASDNGQKPLNQ